MPLQLVDEAKIVRDDGLRNLLAVLLSILTMCPFEERANRMAMEIQLTQSEADAFIGMPKIRIDEAEWDYPVSGAALAIPLTSEDRRTNFFLDLSRGRISLAKGKYQNRVHQSVILVRLDFGGAPHRNPDGVEMDCPHLHIYREGFGDKWAFAVPTDKFSNIADAWVTLQDFMQYCSIIQPPIIQRGLFV